MWKDLKHSSETKRRMIQWEYQEAEEEDKADAEMGGGILEIWRITSRCIKMIEISSA